MQNLPILFLDIHGVLNTPESCGRHRSNVVFLPAAVAALLDIQRRSGCHLVISSSWRMADQRHRIRPVFEKNGLAPLLPLIIGYTPVFPTESEVTREDEIDAWLEQRGRPGSIAILDDDGEQFFGDLRSQVVLIDDRTGLTVENACQCLKLLRSPRAR